MWQPKFAVVSAVFLGLGCGAPACSVTAAPVTAPAAVTAAPGPTSAPVSAGSRPATAVPGTLTDEECLATGGEIVTERTYAHLRRRAGAPLTPFRICRHPSPKNGASCRDSGECAGGRCYCSGELAGPDPALRAGGALLERDGTEGVGACSDRPIPSGSWYCLVVDGRVELRGVIVD